MATLNGLQSSIVAILSACTLSVASADDSPQSSGGIERSWLPRSGANHRSRTHPPQFPLPAGFNCKKWALRKSEPWMR